MDNKHRIITDMCLTMRHDYGLDRGENVESFVFPMSGMTDSERSALYRQMEQLYDHHIQPLVDELKEIRDGKDFS